jgi:hypothetical protein
MEYSKSHVKGIVKQKTIHADNLMRMKNVVGVGVGYKEIKGKQTDEIAVKVYVRKKEPKSVIGAQDIIPELLGTAGKVKTDVVEIGEVNALPAEIPKPSFWEKINPLSLNRKGKFRPIVPGVSVGNKAITAGTVGAVCKWAGKQVLLSNAHVFCESPFNDISKQETEIWQPGPYDNGTPADKVGKLCKMVLIQVSQPNYVDCAVCRMDDGIQLDPLIAELSIPKGIVSWTYNDNTLLNMRVVKSGRTTGVTHGTVTDINASIRVNYGNGKSAVFHEQYVTTNISQGGDSGSLVLREDDMKAVGLLFAGSDTATIVSPIEHVLKPLGIELVTDSSTPEPPVNKEIVINFMLVKENTGNWVVRGIVQDAAANTPVQATLTLDESLKTGADHQGAFAFTGVEEGKHTVLCEAVGYLSQMKEFIIP